MNPFAYVVFRRELLRTRTLDIADRPKEDVHAFRPLHDRVLVRRLEEKTVGGIIIPVSAK